MKEKDVDLEKEEEKEEKEEKEVKKVDEKEETEEKEIEKVEEKEVEEIEAKEEKEEKGETKEKEEKGEKKEKEIKEETIEKENEEKEIEEKIEEEKEEKKEIEIEGEKVEQKENEKEEEKNDNNQISESQIKINESLEKEEDINNNLNSNKYENKIENNELIKEKESIIENKEVQKGDINNITEENLFLIKSKKEELGKKYYYTIEYSEIIFNFINYLNELLYEQINTSIKENLNNISFFDALSKLYSDVYNKLKKFNINVNDNPSKMSNNLIKDSITNIKNLFEINFSTKSENFKRNSDNLKNQIKQNEKKIEEIKKNNSYKINEIIGIKNTLKGKYSESYINLFITDIKITNVIDLPDLVIAIIDLTKHINLLMREINVFIQKSKESLKSLNIIINEINNNAKDIILSFISENKINFNNEISKKIEEIENQLQEYNPKEISFSFQQILNTASQRNKLDNIFKSLSILLGISEDVILIDKFKDIDSFFEFLLENNKEMKSVNIDELILQKFEVQYYPGFMKSWKDCFLYYTPQRHLILCDNKDIISLENIVQIFEMNKINFKLNSSFKKPFIFEISPNYGMLLKRYNTYIFDALNGDNLFKICLIFKDYIIKKGK